MPEAYANGAFIGEHGSWNRNFFNGYKVVYVPFENGKPAGKAQDVVTGFIEGDQARGRPVGVARSAEHTSELQSLMRISYAGFCLKQQTAHTPPSNTQDYNQATPKH